MTTTNSLRALLIPADEDEPMRDIEIHDRGDSCLRDLQDLVGGYIEQVQFPGADNIVAIVNEEGKLRQLAPNYRATRILESTLRGDYIAGNAVLVGVNYATGATVPLPHDVFIATRRHG